MTDKNLTHIVAILDRSGSMEHLRNDTIGGFNSFIDSQKEASVDTKCTVTLVQFDDQYQIDYQDKNINDCAKLDHSTYSPRGSTALFDAVGRTINSVGQSLAALPEEQRPGQVIFLVITDGQENCSQEFLADKVREMVQHQTDKYNWRFVYMGGGNLETHQQQASFIGFASNNTYNFSANAAGTQAVYTSLGSAVVRSRKMAHKDQRVNISDSLLSEQEVESLKN